MFSSNSSLVIYVGDDNLSEGQASLYPSDQPGSSEALQDTAQSPRLGLGWPNLNLYSVPSYVADFAKAILVSCKQGEQNLLHTCACSYTPQIFY